VCLAIGLLVGGLLAGIMLAVCFAMAARLFVSMRVGRRRTRFGDQLVDTLQLLSGALRAGYGLMQAVDAVSREAESPTREEFRRIVVETRLGRSLSDSLRAAGERLGGDDFVWVMQAIEINREVGGDLASVLDTVGNTIRERNQLRRHIKALSAEGRFSAYILLGLPFVIVALVFMTNRAYISELGHGAGLAMVGIAVVLMSIGTLWMRKMCRIVL